MTLGRDFHVLHAAARLGNRQPVGAHPLEVELDRLLNLALDFFDRVAGRHAAGKVGNIRTIVPFAFLDHDRKAHGAHYG